MRNGERVGEHAPPWRVVVEGEECGKEEIAFRLKNVGVVFICVSFLLKM